MARKATDKVVWIDRGWQPVDIGFCPSEEAWIAAAKRYKITQAWPLSSNAVGHTSLMANDISGCAMILVVVRGERDALDVIMTIVHEAVHVWQFLRQQIGEKAPGIEMEAYGIQEITRGLINAYRSTQGKRQKWFRS